MARTATSSAAQSSSGRLGLLFPACAQIVGQAGNIAVVRSEAGELLRVFESRSDVSGIAVERYESQQGIAILGMTYQVFRQDCYCFIPVTRRMQRYGVNVGVARPVRFQLDCCAELSKRIIRTLLAGQCKPKCMVQSCVLA